MFRKLAKPLSSSRIKYGTTFIVLGSGVILFLIRLLSSTTMICPESNQAIQELCECPSCPPEASVPGLNELANSSTIGQQKPFFQFDDDDRKPPQRFEFDMMSKRAVDEILMERREWSKAQWEHKAIEVVRRNKNGKYVIVAIANSGHRNFTLNWIASLKRNGYTKFVVFCLDIDLYRDLLLHGLRDNIVIAPLTWATFEIPAEEHKWMDSNYNRLTQAKIRIQRELLNRGFWIIFADVDLVFLSPHVVDHVDYMIGMYCSEMYPTQCFTDFVYMYDQDTDINTGFFAARPTDLVKKVFSRSIDLLKQWPIDQLAFNYAVRTDLKVKYTKNFKGLDKFLYANGWIAFRRGLTARFGIKPLVVHANYVEGSAAKQAALERAGMWYI